MRKVMAVLGAVLLAASMAAAAGSTVAFGQRVLSVGQSAGSAQQAAGRPDRVVTLYNRFGAVVGERWEYDTGRKTVLITVSQGRIVRIDEIY